MPAQTTCAVDAALKVIGDRWTLGIIHELTLGPRRTVELHRGFKGISTKTLLARLRKLERTGLVIRRSFSESPPRVEYSLTLRGQSLLPVVREIGKSAVLWDELAGHGPDCKACASLSRSAVASNAQAGEPDANSSRQTEQETSRQQIRKRRDVTLL
jgi:DNA-binding HxlR family transcriptional regulator